MADDEVRITLRLPGALRDALQGAADRASRSMNGEIVERLDYTFARLDALAFEAAQAKTALLDLAARRQQLLEANEKIAELRKAISVLQEQNADLESKAVHAQDYMRRNAEWRRSSQNLTVLVDVSGRDEPWMAGLSVVGKISDLMKKEIWGVECIMFDLSKLAIPLESHREEYLVSLIAKHAIDRLDETVADPEGVGDVERERQPNPPLTGPGRRKRKLRIGGRGGNN